MITRIADIFMVLVLSVFLVIAFSFAITGVCLVASDQNCRDNVAGEIVYQTVSLVI